MTVEIVPQTKKKSATEIKKGILVFDTLHFGFKEIIISLAALFIYFEKLTISQK